MASKDDPIVISSSPDCSPVKDEAGIDRDRSASKALLDSRPSDDDTDTTDRSRLAAYSRHDQKSDFDSSPNPAVAEQNLLVGSSSGEIQPPSSRIHADSLPLMPATNVETTGTPKSTPVHNFADKLPYTGATFGRPSLFGAYVPDSPSDLGGGPIFKSSSESLYVHF